MTDPGVSFPFVPPCGHPNCRGPRLPIIPVTLRFEDGPPLQRPMLVDSGADSSSLSLDVALQLGMKPWQLLSGTSRQIDGTPAEIVDAPLGLSAGFWGFPPRPLPAIVQQHRRRVPRKYDVLGRRSLFGPFTILFEEGREGPRVVLIEPGTDPFHLPLDPSSGGTPSTGDGWASFPYRRGSYGRPRPIVPVRFWRRRAHAVDVPMVVDTGTDMTVIPMDVARELGLPMWRMPRRQRARSDGGLHDVVAGVGVTLHAQIGGLPPVDLPFAVLDGSGPLAGHGNLSWSGLLDQYRIVFHRQEGSDRVTFLDADRFPPA